MIEKNRVHQPVIEGKACLTCHGPHASKGKGLLRGGAAVVCGSCHADTIRTSQRAKDKHPPVVSGECGACHDPHSAGGALLLVNDDRIGLCAKCHDWTGHSSHPIGEKRVDPRNKNLRVTCQSCHRVHGSEFAKLMPYAKQTDLCVKCHTSYTR